MEEIRISKKLLYSGLSVLMLGFMLMARGDETYSFLKITFSPLLIIMAFVLIAFSLMRKTKNIDV